MVCVWREICILSWFSKRVNRIVRVEEANSPGSQVDCIAVSAVYFLGYDIDDSYKLFTARMEFLTQFDFPKPNDFTFFLPSGITSFLLLHLPPKHYFV